MAADIKPLFRSGPRAIGAAAAKASIEVKLALPDVKFELPAESVVAAASGDLAIYHSAYQFSLTNPETRRPFVELGNWVAIR